MFGGRSRHASGSVRSHRPKKSSSSSSNSREEELAARQPDVDEVRRRRDAYFGPSLAERRKVVTPLPAPKSKDSRKSRDGGRASTRSRSAEHVKRSSKPSKSSSSSGGSSRKSSSRRHRDHADDLVYTRAGGGGGGVVVGGGGGGGDGGDESPPSVRSGRSKRSSPTYDDEEASMPSIMEQEVTPDDSISQVAANPRPRPRPAARDRPRSTRPPLPPIDETSAPASPPARPPRRDSLLDSLFRRRPAAPVKLVSCLTCGSDDVPSSRAATLACSHTMCHSCLKRLFRLAVHDPAHMPPRCCTSAPIPLSHVDALFPVKFKLLFNAKLDESLVKNRLYCPNPRCGAWIRPAHFTTSAGRKSATCPKCRTKACTLCAGKLHKSLDCPKDPDIARIVQQAEEEGWQRCYACHAMVELREGCNHMTCRCTAEFCMVCGKKWKTCACPWFNHTTLQEGDRLGEMRVPEPVRVVFRRVVGVTAPRAAAGAARADPLLDEQQQPPPPPPQPRRALTYAEEMEQRRRQERADEELARRLQMQGFEEFLDEDVPLRPRRRREPREPRVGEETIGLGNAAGHFLNDDFRPTGAGPGSMRGFGDEAMGRRGERSSGRRKAVRHSAPPVAGGGLVGDFLGSESVLMGGLGARRVGTVRRRV